MPKQSYTVPLSAVIKETTLEIIHMPCDPDTRLVSAPDVNRPGLALSGYLDYFDNDRIQVMGKNEYGFLSNLPHDLRASHVDELIRTNPPAIIISRDLPVLDELQECCEKYGVPLLRSRESTSSLMAALIAFLNVQLAPRITRHGVLVEVYGEGVLLLGDSGIGKSETAIELVKRGHRLIADDAVEIRRVSAKTLVGSAPDNIRHFTELRGVGIINVRRMYGIGSVKNTEKIDMAIQMEPWENGKAYDRMGLNGETIDILGIHVPSITIPVSPGRNLAIIIENAAMSNRQKKMGYNAAEELMHRLGMMDETGLPTNANAEWEKF
ncbi:MAG: HPr(Ser) kinase/phosphatase [Ruminococcaceae bacterium]|nr:HPr(Ser) kinase/phosphatase [Oscillospiraceae bacterium]